MPCLQKNTISTIVLLYKFLKEKNSKTQIVNHTVDLKKNAIEEDKFESHTPRDEPFSQENLGCRPINQNIFNPMMKTNYRGFKEESKQLPELQTTKIF